MTLAQDIERNIQVRGSTTLTGVDRALIADFSRRAFESELVRAQRVT